MATATTLSAWDNALKQYYRGKEVEKVVYDSHPFMELVPKDEKFRGKNAPIPVYYTRPQGRSATFATAQSNASASKIGEFLLTRVSNYGVATISGEAVAASEGDRYSFLNLGLLYSNV
jgi:ABC-type thiamine transport system substrate-binding protein